MNPNDAKLQKTAGNMVSGVFGRRSSIVVDVLDHQLSNVLAFDCAKY